MREEACQGRGHKALLKCLHFMQKAPSSFKNNLSSSDRSGKDSSEPWRAPTSRLSVGSPKQEKPLVWCRKRQPPMRGKASGMYFYSNFGIRDNK